MYLKIKKKYVVSIMIIFSIIMILGMLFSDNIFLRMILPVVYVLFLSLIIIDLIKKQTTNDEKTKKFAKEIENTIEKNILNCIYPVTIIDSSGKLYWFNKAFKDIYNNINLNENRIAAVVRGLDVNKILGNEKISNQRIDINNIKYEVSSKPLKTELGEMYYIINFSDVSNSKELYRQCIILVEVDNLKEMEAYIDIDDMPQILASIQKSINQYGASIGAMVKKYQYDKYILTALDSKIPQIVAEKTGILACTRDIPKRKQFDVTLSVGIGRYGENSYENHEFATKAIDLALGRGGDQIVIKSKDETKFYGGNKNALEKISKVRARVVAHALRDIIYESSKVFVVGHKNIDMDCFGSALGISSVVKSYGIECNIVLNSDIKAIENFLNDIKSKHKYDGLIINEEYAMSKIDDKTLIIVVDVQSEQYIANIDLLNKCDRVVIIDHHRKSADYLKNTLLTYLEVYASSTSELVTELIQYMQEKPVLSITEAEGLLAGLVMDTKNFTFKTGVRTFEAAAYLRKRGADTVEVKKIFNNDLDSYIARFEIIKSAEIEEGIAISVCPDNISEVVFAAQGADELINIVGIECSFVFVKIKNKINLSSRSIGNINVQLIMESLGGGGHKTMAGTQFEDITIEEAKNRLKEALNEYFKKVKGDE